MTPDTVGDPLSGIHIVAPQPRQSAASREWLAGGLLDRSSLSSEAAALSGAVAFRPPSNFHRRASGERRRLAPAQSTMRFSAVVNWAWQTVFCGARGMGHNRSPLPKGEENCESRIVLKQLSTPRASSVCCSAALSP